MCDLYAALSSVITALLLMSLYIPTIVQDGKNGTYSMSNNEVVCYKLAYDYDRYYR